MSTDRERASQEMRELERQVSSAFETPEALSPPIQDAGKRPRLRIWERPAFANHRCWTIWGGSSDRGLLRRIEWRRDLDIVGADPIKRLALLGRPLHASLWIADGEVRIEELGLRLGPLPVVEPEFALHRGRTIHVDGGRFGIEIEDGSANYRFESAHPWLSNVCGWLDVQLSAGG